MQQSELLKDSKLVNDDERVVVFDKISPSFFDFVYVDNLGVLVLKENNWFR